MRNQKNHTPPHIKINCWMYHLFLTPPIGVLCCHISLAAHNPLQAVPQNSRPEWNAVSACGPVGKPHPVSRPNTEMQFPQSLSTGNHIPFQRQIPGHSFRTPVSRKKPREFRGFHVCIISSARRRLSTRPARPFWRLQPCCPDPPWWDDPLRQPSCRATT